MGGNDHCPFFGCSNSRNEPERVVAQFFVLFFKLLLIETWWFIPDDWNFTALYMQRHIIMIAMLSHYYYYIYIYIYILFLDGWGKVILITSAKSWSARGASHQPAFTNNCLTISLTCLPCLPSGGMLLFWSDLFVFGRVVSWERRENTELGRW